MKMRTFFAAVLAAAAVCRADAEGITVRPSESGRIWQVSYAPEEPIRWAWPSEATAATLTVTSYVGRTSVATFQIARQGDEDTGAYQLPSCGREHMFDLALSVFAGEKEIETQFARVVVLPSQIDVIPEGSKAWTTVRDREPRPVAYDTAWAEAPANSAALSMTQGGASQDLPCAGTSGFEPLDLVSRLDRHADVFSLSLVFDDTEATAFYADLLRTFPGMTFSVR